jgi:dephospho-CoA kinase
MYKIGLTGGIGSGKSRVADLLAEWGAAIIDSDVIAHELTAPGGAAIEPIRKHFGPDVIAATGALDRQAMRELVFESPGARQQLESIIHPMIKSVVRQRTDEAEGCYLVYVVPLLVESGQWRDRVDRICVVDCDEATQIERVRTRSGLTVDTITRIMSAQATREARLAVADDVVVNDAQTSVEQLIRQSRLLHEKWCRMALDSHPPR